MKQHLEEHGADREEIEAVEAEPEQELQAAAAKKPVKKAVLRAPGTKDKPGAKVSGSSAAPVHLLHVSSTCGSSQR